MYFLSLLLVFNLQWHANGDSNFPTVKTNYGVLEGEYVYNADGRSVEAFLGIPFAKPPLGSLRFKHPEPPESWTETLKVKQYSNSCHQFFPKLLKKTRGSWRVAPTTPSSEDCLYLNVWTPTPRPTGSPVVIFMHSGAFTLGSAASYLYNPSNWVAQENIIVVTINYRLASLGFMYLEHPEIDKNVGLMDQVMAFKWVQDNIAAFGGDPERVTLQGSSAGSISVGFHLLSPISKDLFQRAILESGYPTGKWAVKNEKDMEKLTTQLLENLECPTENISLSVECLKNADPEYIIENEPRVDYEVVKFYPVVDGIFFPQDPEDLLKTGSFKSSDILMGVTKNEGTFLACFYEPIVFNINSDKVTPTKKDISAVADHLFQNAPEVIRKAIEFQYVDFDELDNSEALLEAMDTMSSDLVFICPGNKFAKAYSKSGNDVYAYLFSHRSPATEWPEWIGVPHTEEFGYIYGEPFFNGSKYTNEDKMFSHRMMRYWANFARTGNPNMSPEDDINLPFWPKYTFKERQHFILNGNSSGLLPRLREKECQFWDLLIPYLEAMKTK